MTKKVIFNGIELSHAKYDKSTLTIFDYLDKIINSLEKGLGKKDENFQFSINVDFAANKPPKHKIYSNGSTTKSTKEKVAKILNNTKAKDYSHTTGSVKVNLMVKDSQ